MRAWRFAILFVVIVGVNVFEPSGFTPSTWFLAAIALIVAGLMDFSELGRIERTRPVRRPDASLESFHSGKDEPSWKP